MRGMILGPEWGSEESGIASENAAQQREIEARERARLDRTVREFAPVIADMSRTAVRDRFPMRAQWMHLDRWRPCRVRDAVTLPGYRVAFLPGDLTIWRAFSHVDRARMRPGHVLAYSMRLQAFVAVCVEGIERIDDA